MVMNKVKESIKVILGKIKMPKITMPKIKIPSIKIPSIKMPKFKMPKVNIPKISIPKIKIPTIDMEKLKAYGAKYFPIIKKVFEILVKIVKGFISWLWKAVKESIAQVWTLLGFFIAWLTLTGTAQQVVGMATLIATAIWLVTIPLREEKED
jgi:hypothetical protein